MTASDRISMSIGIGIGIGTSSNSLLVTAAAAALFLCAFSVPQRVDGLSVPLASDPTNVRNQWDLPGKFGSVTIPGASIRAGSFSSSHGTSSFFDDHDDNYGFDFDFDFSKSPLSPVEDWNAAAAHIPYSHEYSHEHGYDYYGGRSSSLGSRSGSFSGRALSMTSFTPPQVWRYNDNNLFVNGGKPRNAGGNRRSNSRPWATPALSMANYMQNGGPGNARNNGPPAGNYNSNGNYNDNYNDNNNNNNGYNNGANSNYNYNNNPNNRYGNGGNSYNNDGNNYGGGGGGGGGGGDEYYDNYNGQNRNHRQGSYNNNNNNNNNDRYRPGPPPPSNSGPRGGGPRGTTRFNTVGGLGSINGANLSRDGRSLQFQNRRDSNTAGRSGRMMDDPFAQFAPDNNSRFGDSSKPPNDNYARGGYRQDSRDGYWKDPNDYNVQNGPSYSNSNSNPRDSSSRYASSTVPSSGFKPLTHGDYVTAPSVTAGPFGYDSGRGGAGGNVPYDNAYYNNNNNHHRDYDNGGGGGYKNNNYNNRDSDDDYYSRNGNVMDNRRRSAGRGAPGANENYFNLDNRDSNRRLDRGGGLLRYRPNYNQRRGGSGSGNNGYDNQNPEYYYDDYYDSSGSFYNHEGKRVRRFDPNFDRPEGYYNPDHITDDMTDPERMVQNQRRRDGRDVKSGASLRRYNPEYDSNQGLYDEAALYGSDVKGTRHYTPSGYGDDNMSHRVVPRRKINRREPPPPPPPGGDWGEAGGSRDQFSMRPPSIRPPEYRDDEYVDDGYDRDRDRFNNNNNNNRERDGRQHMGGGDRDIGRRGGGGGDDYYDDYNDYDVDRRGGARRGLGRRDMDGERDYYRSGDYGGPKIRRDDSMERFRQGKDVKKSDLYGFETGTTPSSKKRIRTGGKDPRMGGGRQRVGMRRPEEDPRNGRGSTVNGSYNNHPPPPGSRGGRMNGSGGRDRGLSLDDLNEMFMVAKSPQKNPTTWTTTGNNGQAKDRTTGGTKRNPDKFAGHNQTDLKGILIPEDATAKHYLELKERLETLGGSKYIPKAGLSIKALTRFKRKDFDSTEPTANEYSREVINDATNEAQTVEISNWKETLMVMYKEKINKKADKWIQYQRDMEKMHQLTLGQIDNGMKAKLKGLAEWKAISEPKCIIKLLKAVHNLCFQSSRTKVHPVTNAMRDVRKLLCTQQRNLDVASYVKMVNDNLEVVKSLGGTLMCKATAYLAMSNTTKAGICRAVEQRAVAAIIIEGSDTETSNLRQVLANNYTVQQNNYPVTSIERLNIMLVAFKDSKKSNQSCNNNNNNNNQNANAGGNQTNSNGKQTNKQTNNGTSTQDSSESSSFGSAPPALVPQTSEYSDSEAGNSITDDDSWRSEEDSWGSKEEMDTRP
eukprot:jgi/Psemu1/32147/gm1.32147_g